MATAGAAAGQASTRDRADLTDGRRLAALLGRLQPLRTKRDVPLDANGWLEATFRIDSIEGSTIDVLSLGPQVEVDGPPELRDAVADWAARTNRIYRRRRGEPKPA